MATTTKTPKAIEAKALRPAVAIADRMSDAVIEEIGLMYRDLRRQLLKVFRQEGYDHAMDDITPQARILMNAMRRKWQARFNRLGKRVAEKMVDDTVKNSTVTLGMSLKEASEFFKINSALMDERTRSVIQASTEQAAGLIKRIPEKLLGDVQGEVMRAITTGKGQADLVPFLTKKYEGDVRWARHVAMDQQRKAYSNINTARLQAIGCKSFIWIHTGGGRYPREDHIAMNGKEYRFDDLPVIDKRTGERGKPGDAVFCRCVMKPVFRFDE